MNKPSMCTDRIFIVDDEPSNLKLLDKLLTSQGYTNLVTIQDSREVLLRYAEGRPDLILLDINMPYLDGYQVMEQLRALGDPLLAPIVILTAQHSRDFLLKALTAGARDFVGKPFDRLELLMRVRNLLEAHSAHRMALEQNDLLESMVQERTKELNDTRLQVVRHLGRAAEYRDNETGLHIIRMSKMAAALAKSLAWNVADCELMLLASPMHDIGKIGIPDGILLKAGKFEPHEWQIMQTHATIGADILSDGDSDLLRLASLIALTHHEKWDGSGYPSGLAGNAIPQAGRIVAIADVFDALTSARPYKRAWSIEQAVALITERSGTHFDPEVVEHFHQCLPEILIMRDQHLEPVVDDCDVGQ
ncbi:MAG: response regulator [Rhodocyclaceae bacterium]|nr:response regulator [Rhodocyclaceae bacterium]